jgi:hypothetical protein
MTAPPLHGAERLPSEFGVRLLLAPECPLAFDRATAQTTRIKLLAAAGAIDQHPKRTLPRYQFAI